MDERLRPAPAVLRFAERAAPMVDVVGIYAGGSLATADFELGRSDLDLLAIVENEFDAPTRDVLVAMHRDLQRSDPAAAKLHCLYAPRRTPADVATPHLVWAHGQLLRRPLGAIFRAELLRHGIIVVGPPPGELLPSVDDAELRAAARAELSGYWAGAVRKPWLWLRDEYVDLGLLTLARADATLSDGLLLTKREAVGRLDRLGVDRELSEEIAARRHGHAIPLTPPRRVRRALVARRVVARNISELLTRH